MGRVGATEQGPRGVAAEWRTMDSSVGGGPWGQYQLFVSLQRRWRRAGVPADTRVIVVWPSKDASTRFRFVLVVSPQVPDCSPVPIRERTYELRKRLLVQVKELPGVSQCQTRRYELLLIREGVSSLVVHKGDTLTK